MNTRQKIFLGLGIFFALIFFAFIFAGLFVHGFVDGDKNGKDDVKQAWDFLKMNNTDVEHQNERFGLCNSYWNGTWGYITRWNGLICELEGPYSCSYLLKHFDRDSVMKPRLEQLPLKCRDGLIK